jgi:hypothetical protein
VKFPLSAGLALIALKASILASMRFRVDARSDPSLTHDRERRMARIPLNTAFTDIEAGA